MKKNRCIAAALGAALALSCAGHASAQVEQNPTFENNPVIVDDVQLVADALEAVGVSRGDVIRMDVPEAVRAFETNIPVLGEMLTLRVEPYSTRADNFRLVRQLPDGSYIDVEPEAPKTVRGEIVEMPGTHVAGSVDERGFTGQIYLPDLDRKFWVEPVAGRADGADREHHVVYESSDVLFEGGTCGTVGEDIVAPEIDGDQAAAQRGSGDCGGLCVAEIACDMDVEWNNSYGGNGAAQIESIINAMNPQYENEVGITHLITMIVERTGSTNSDPYTTSSAGGLLNQFSNVWNSGFNDVERDVAQLFTGRNLDGSTIGIAQLGVICFQSSAYSVVQNIGGFSCRTDLSSHELGHNWSAQHCNCPGNTMNPSLTCANTFAQVTINQITNFRNSRGCLDAFEAGTTMLPFFDDFPTTSLDTSLWTGIEGATASTGGINEPSGNVSLNLTGGAEIRSARMDASLSNDLIFAFFYQRTGTGNSTETGDDLVAEYFNDMNQWTEVDRQLGSGPDMTTFEQVIVNLPSDAEHEDLRIRFRNTSNNVGFDDWFVDDVTVTGTLALPGDFSLTSPSDGATGVSTSPTFNWTQSSDALSYVIVVDDDEDLSSPILNTTTTSAFFSNPGFQLPNNAEYFWSVTAVNPNGTTASTPDPASFVVGQLEEPFCPGDCTGDGVVNFSDLTAILFQFGDADGAAPGCDATSDGQINFNDLTATLFAFGPCE